jgi:hypothetical protein
MSSDADASWLPSGENATAFGGYEVPQYDGAVAETDAICAPPREKATALTESLWSLSTRSSFPESAFHISTLLPVDADARTVLSAGKAGSLMQCGFLSVLSVLTR